MQPEIIADYQCVTGEGPLWHPMDNCVYWVDIPTGRMFRYQVGTGTHEQFYQGDVVGGFTIQQDGSLLLFMAKGAVKIWRSSSLHTVIEEIPDESNSRFNDVIAGPEGRVYCGTMSSPKHKGRLYRLDTDGKLTKLLEGIGTSNGMGFTPDGKQMYYTDSREREIYLFDYERSTGALTNQRVFLKVPEGEGVPDGMTVDSMGYVWSARWDGACVVRYSPEGREVERVSFPAKKVSSITFGGEEYQTAYVTTAGGKNKGAEGQGAGALFRFEAKVPGVPEFFSNVRLDLSNQAPNEERK